MTCQSDSEHLPVHTPVLIVGAGPAGLTAAAHLSAQGIACTVVDEASQIGGQIGRRRFDRRFSPRSYGWARPYRKMLEAEIGSENIRWLLRHTVWAISDAGDSGASMRRMRGPGAPVTPEELVAMPEGQGRFKVHLAREGTPMEAITCDRLLLAPGAYDAPLLIHGWATPGVVGLGALQTIAKTDGLAKGDRILVYGTHPLGLVGAAEVVRKGYRVSGVMMPQTTVQLFWDALRFAAVPVVGARKLPQLLGALCALFRARVPIRVGRRLTAVEGDSRIESVTLTPWGRTRESRIECDVLGIGGGFLTSSELLRSVGAGTTWDLGRGGWLARHDEWQQSTKPGVYVAGEITGVAGGESAAAEGLLAAHAISASLNPNSAGAVSKTLRRRVRVWARFGRAMAAVGAVSRRRLLDQTDDHTLLCRCESVTVGDVRRTRDRYPGLVGIRDIKMITRLGMGPCQARYCGPLTCGLFPDNAGNESAQGEELRSREPVKPLRVTELNENKGV